MLGGVVTGFHRLCASQESRVEAVRTGCVAKQEAGPIDAYDVDAIGPVNWLVSEYCGRATAFFMNSAQIGAAA